MSDAGYQSDSDSDSGIGRPIDSINDMEDDNFSSESDPEEEGEVRLPPPAMAVSRDQVVISRDEELPGPSNADPSSGARTHGFRGQGGTGSSSSSSSSSNNNTTTNNQKGKKKNKKDGNSTDKSKKEEGDGKSSDDAMSRDTLLLCDAEYQLGLSPRLHGNASASLNSDCTVANNNESNMAWEVRRAHVEYFKMSTHRINPSSSSSTGLQSLENSKSLGYG